MAVAAKRKQVPTVEFLAAYRDGVKSGKTAAEVAEQLGMELASFNVRVSQLKARFRKEKGRELASLKGSGTANRRKLDFDKLEEIAGDILSDLEEETPVEDETETE